MLNLLRNLLSCSLIPGLLLVALIAAASPMTAAEPADDTGQSLPNDVRIPPCDELCGWVETGSHDTTPVSSQPSPTASIASPTIHHAVAEKSLEVLRKFQRWWDAAAEMQVDQEASASDVIVFDFLRIQIPSQGTPDPVCLRQSMLPLEFSPSAALTQLDGLTGDFAAETTVGARTDDLVGSSPMIFTVEESYLAYDLSDRDSKLWAVLPSNNRPFCIRDRGAEFDATSIWVQFDSALTTQPDRMLDSTSNDLDCSPDSLLDRCINRWSAMNESRAALARSLDAVAVGRRMAKLVEGRNRLARRMAAAFARSWPKVEPEPAPSAAGAALLARAGAVASESSNLSESVPVDRISALPEMLTESSHR